MIISISGKINSGKDTIGKILQILLNNPHLNNEGVLSFLKKDINFDSPYYKTWQIKKFADKLKDIVCILLSCTREQLEDRDFKEKELGEEWDFYQPEKFGVKGFVLDANITYDEKLHRGLVKQKMTPRLLLQLLGTECGRQILHPNVWVNALMSEYKPLVSYQNVLLDMSSGQMEKIGKSVEAEYPNWVITDTRFPNELKAVKDKQGVTIRVNRDYVLTGGPEDPKDQHESETALDNAEFDYVIENDGTLLELIGKVREILKK